MKIVVITPVAVQSRQGNRVTALRWARLLKALGHQVTVAQQYEERPYDLMVALHARRSCAAIARFRRLYPARPLLVALTGTDLYGDIRTSVEAQESLELATALILLQPKGIEELPEHLHPKARVIYQSVPRPLRHTPRSKTTFDVCVLGHLRPVKDPLRTALAARLVPATSRLRVLHVGKALSDDMAVEARTEMAENPRYHWLGELPRWKALRVLARSHVLVLSSRMKGEPMSSPRRLRSGCLFWRHILLVPSVCSATTIRDTSRWQRRPHSRACWSKRSATLTSTMPSAPGVHAWHPWCIPSASPGPGRASYTKSLQDVRRSRRCSWGQSALRPSLAVTVSRETVARWTRSQEALVA